MTVKSKQYAVSRKQYTIIGKQLSYVCCLLLTAYCLLFTTCSFIPKQKVWKIDIKDVYHKEIQYLKARVSNDLNTLYSLQHPEYKAIITLDKFLSSGGHSMLDYSAVTGENPLPGIYSPIQQLPVFVRGFRIERFFIDKDERYAKFHVILIMDMFLPMAMGQPIRREVRDINYWERFNGEWIILNKLKPAPSPHISGAVTTTDLINFSEEKAEYREVDYSEPR